jgi:hypothetical protein
MLAFEYYEASAIAYNGNRKAREAAVRNEADAVKLLDQAERCLAMARKRRHLVRDVFPKHRELLYPIDFDRYPLLRGDDWGAGPIWAVLDWAAKSDKVRARLRQMAGSQTAASLPAKAMLVMLDKQSQPVSKEPSFEDPGGEWPAAWSRWIKWGTGSIEVSPRAAHSGKLGVVCRGVKRGGPLQMVEAPPGRYAAVALFRVPRAPKGNATISLSMTPLDEQGANLPGPSTTLRARAGDWTRIATAGPIPGRIDGKPVKSVRLIVVLDGFGPGEEVYLDDVAMLRIE